MFKRKLGLLLIIFMLLTMVTFSISLAEDEINTNDIEPMALDSQDDSVEPIAIDNENTNSTETNDTTTDDSETVNQEDLKATIKEYYKQYYAEYLGNNSENNDLYKIDAKDIVIDKNVSGNVFVIGNKVTISAEAIHGDVYVMGSDVTLKSSEIAGNVYVLADNLKIDSASIGLSLYAVSNDISFYGGVLDVYASANTITIEKDSFIERDLHLACDTLNFYGAVCRNAYLDFEKINVLSEQELADENTLSGIFGNLEYSSSESVKLPDDFVGGKTDYTKKEINSISIQTIAISILESVVFMIMIFALLSIFAKKFTNDTHSVLSNNLAKVALKGLLFIILIPILVILLFMLGITMRVALVLIGIYFILLSIATTILVIALSQLISNKFKLNNKAGKVAVFILLAIIYAALVQIPYAGPVISIVAAILGVGIILQKNSHSKDDTFVTVESTIQNTAVEVSNNDDSDNSVPTDVENDNKDDKSDEENN